MSSTDLETLDLTDPELISLVRAGDVTVYGTLFRRHVEAATRLARLLVGGSDADDLVSEAFVKVLSVLLSGGGPDVAFRAYLLTAVRRLHIDKIRSNQRTTTDDLAPFDPGVPFTDTAVAGFEGGAAAKAFASLPERWQMVLWHLEVENQKPSDIAPLLGMTPNSVSALAYRAREGLRQAFLTMHSGDLVNEACRETNASLGAYVRGGLSRRESTRVETHLEHCRRCAAVYLELSEVNSSLAALLGPALLGSAAAAYLGGGAATGVGASVMLVAGRGKEVLSTHLSAAALTAGVVGVAGVTAVTAVTLIHRSPPRQPTTAPPSVSSRFPVFLAPTTSDPTTSSRDDQTGERRPAPSPRTSATTVGTAGTPAPIGQRSQENVSAGVGDPVQSTAGTGTDAAPRPAEPHPLRTQPPTTQPPRTQPPRTQPPRTQPPGPRKPGGVAPGSTPTTPKPKPQPQPQPQPKPDPPPKPPTDPPPQPTPPPQPRPQADVRVSAWSTSDRRGDAVVRVRVSGVPRGGVAALTATTSAGELRAMWGHCRRSGTGYACAVPATLGTSLFGVHAHSGCLLTFTVAPPSGYSDPSPGNNIVRITVPAATEPTFHDIGTKDHHD